MDNLAGCKRTISWIGTARCSVGPLQPRIGSRGARSPLLHRARGKRSSQRRGTSTSTASRSRSGRSSRHTYRCQMPQARRSSSRTPNTRAATCKSQRSTRRTRGREGPRRPVPPPTRSDPSTWTSSARPPRTTSAQSPLPTTWAYSSPPRGIATRVKRSTSPPPARGADRPKCSNSRSTRNSCARGRRARVASGSSTSDVRRIRHSWALGSPSGDRAAKNFSLATVGTPRSSTRLRQASGPS